MTIYFSHSEMSAEDAEKVATKLEQIAGCSFRTLISVKNGRSYWGFAGTIEGFDVTVWIDTGDWFWHATTTVGNFTIINSYAWDIEKCMKSFVHDLASSLESKAYRLLERTLNY